MKPAIELLLEIQSVPRDSVKAVPPTPINSPRPDLPECRKIVRKLANGLLLLDAPEWVQPRPRTEALSIMAAKLDRLADLCDSAEGFDDTDDPFADCALPSFRQWLAEVARKVNAPREARI